MKQKIPEIQKSKNIQDLKRGKEVPTPQIYEMIFYKKSYDNVTLKENYDKKKKIMQKTSQTFLPG